MSKCTFSNASLNGFDRLTMVKNYFEMIRKDVTIVLPNRF